MNQFHSTNGNQVCYGSVRLYMPSFVWQNFVVQKYFLQVYCILFLVCVDTCGHLNCENVFFVRISNPV
jgi:hypothetical protein